MPDPKAYPDGIKALADYTHGKGLLFEIYSDSKLTTCVKRPGSLYHEKKDAQLFADWGVDHLKQQVIN
ncbi:alpha-galactosidase 3-like isoform X2 [Gigaspora margarita]|uniref:Alpha-galactosidase n=1 Tax=Gigaspora margarita TaxID=4874 RepID=A0A8H4AEF8_GIGMA|nr:alpha-galactosidase 3-like isoform X2 [Gigaspora margarita]